MSYRRLGWYHPALEPAPDPGAVLAVDVTGFALQIALLPADDPIVDYHKHNGQDHNRPDGVHDKGDTDVNPNPPKEGVGLAS